MVKSSELLLNVRLCFYTVAFIHLVIAAVVILSIDMSSDGDPRVSAYFILRWRLLTCWFNLITMAYFPACLYCDWKEKRGQGDDRRVIMVRKAKDLVMTSILFPTIMYADIIFWRLWNKDPSLIAPLKIFEYLPAWAHHSLHSVSMVVVVLDLLLVPRRRPDSLLPGLALMTAFFSTYCAVLFLSHRNGSSIYTLIDVLDSHKRLVLLLYSYIEYLFYFMTQWCIIDLIWGRRKTQKIKMK
ncbi:androgen-dependent TFPI-regulating protein-like [Epargyreus clarus]|uniref:androgen-dependent TFPI-regulating protein-like n=1 Tax=Epargyreus clarus TaxID=520877 RepID=UPI003C309CE1